MVIATHNFLKRCHRHRLRLGTFVLTVISFICVTPTHGQWHTNKYDQQTALQQLKKTAISANSDARAALAHSIFSRIARSWDSPRLTPNLFVVDAEDQVWAASLDDGSIIITLDAIEVTQKNESPSSQDRIAFVLAHELAHQRADHLWRERYFGDVKNGTTPREAFSADLTARLLQTNQERQADAEAVILMLLSGFDPFKVLSDTRFFDQWITAALGDDPCTASAPVRAQHQSCAEGARRVNAARDQLFHIATQATLFDLGVFAFAVGDYESALRCFEAFGRLFPAAAIHANIGLTHIALALDARARLARHDRNETPAFDYPLILRQNPISHGNAVSRGNVPEKTKVTQLRDQLENHLKAAIRAFEKAIQLEPLDPKHYLNLASAYLLDRNVSMARGVLEGKFAKTFSPTPASMLISARIEAEENRDDVALKLVKGTIEHLQKPTANNTDQALLLSAYRNLEVLLVRVGKPTEATSAWEELAQWSNNNGMPLLFTQTRRRLGNNRVSARSNVTKSTQRPERKNTPDPTANAFVLWLDGDQLFLHLLDEGTRLITDRGGRTVARWQRYNDSTTKAPTIDRIIARYGTPTNIASVSGTNLLSFEGVSTGFELDGESAVGWFQYSSLPNSSGVVSTIEN